MSGIILEIDPTSEDAANVPLVLVDNTTYFLLSEEWPEPEVDQPLVSTISTEGELPVTARHKNTTGTFQVRVVGSTAATLQTALNYIDKKLAKIMREGGTLKRTTPSGSTYVTDLIAGAAAFQFDRRYLNSNRCDVTVTLPRRPYWRLPAVTLTTHTETTLPALVFTEGGASASFSATATALTPSLYWRHGELAGTTATDTSGNSRTGTYAAGVTVNQTGLLASDSDKAISLDGTANAKVTSTYNPFTGNLTVCGWANATTLAVARNVFGGSATNGPLVQIQTDGSVIWWSDLAAATQTWVAGTWVAATRYFWALTWNNSTKVSELFLNGVSQGTKTSANAFNATPGNFMLAGSSAGSGFLGTMDETLVFAGTILSSANITALYNAGASGPIQGDVPALGRLIVTEAQAADQFWLTYGIQSRYYSSSADAALFYEAEGRTAMGGSATNTGPSGASGTSVMRSTTLATSYIAVVGTQATGAGNHLAHVGDFQVYARVQTPTANTGAVSVALQWAQGDFLRSTVNTTTTFPVDSYDGTWRLVDLGQVSLQKVAQGTQRWEGRILAKSTVAGDKIDVDYLMLVPITEGSGRVSSAHGYQTPTAYTVRDEFAQGSGVLNAVTLPIGGTWATSGATTDFQVSGTGFLTRTTIADAGPRFAVAGTSVLTATEAQTDVQISSILATTTKAGLLLRWTDASNYAAAYVKGTYPAGTFLELVVVVAGVATTYTSTARSFGIGTQSISLRARIFAGGAFSVGWANAGSVPAETLTGSDANLATGGTLASGKVGLFDFCSSGGPAVTRTYDNFYGFAPVPDAAVFASKQTEIRSDRVIRQDSTGAVWATPTSFQGDYLLIPASGREGRTSRIIVKGARNDPASGIDSSIDDISAQLIYTPRFLTLPE